MEWNILARAPILVYLSSKVLIKQAGFYQMDQWVLIPDLRLSAGY